MGPDRIVAWIWSRDRALIIVMSGHEVMSRMAVLVLPSHLSASNTTHTGKKLLPISFG
jgi:hypothetical protein